MRRSPKSAPFTQHGTPAEFNANKSWRTLGRALVKETLQQEPTSGFLFVFLNKRRNRLKILTYDGAGLWVLTKRLDRGTYAAPAGEGQSVNLRPEDLTLLIHGIESTSRRQWHRV